MVFCIHIVARATKRLKIRYYYTVVITLMLQLFFLYSSLNETSLFLCHYSAPVVTDVNSAEVIYDANSLRLTLQFTVINGSGTPTLNVSPPAAALGSVQNTSSSTFSADITLLYNANYTLTITDINCAGQERQHINFLRGTLD